MVTFLDSPDRQAFHPEAFWILLFIVCGCIGIVIYARIDRFRLTRSRGKRRRQKVEHNFAWPVLYEAADVVVKRVLIELPPSLRDEAVKIPCLFHNWSPRRRGKSLLGLYTGFQENLMRSGEGRIDLFLGNIFQWSDEDLSRFEEEVRITYLHELGHHFGWDEDTLTEVGLR